ncbi:MAG: lpxD [Chlamydiales bacterium]|jgi:UDP-3-O-[3-hydroxymyristoyl] glucosamine N-acyltransferase|nr:lpxD [Chlamydiales bacterium]
MNNSHLQTVTLAELAAMTDSKLQGPSEYVITGIDELSSATANEVSFLANPRYIKAMQTSEAGAIFIAPENAVGLDRNLLITANPSAAFQKAIEIFCHLDKKKSHFEGIHPSAVIDSSVKLGKNVTIYPYAVIDQGVNIEDESIIGMGVFVGAGSQIGKNCTIHAHVTIREGTIIGNRVIIQPGAVIGSCGFGYIPQANGTHLKLEQFGCVIIEDDVEIGANTTVDRARFKATIISKGTKIDNLVQIAHGVFIGKNNVIIAQTGFAGSSETGDQVLVAGQSAVTGHINICAGAQIAGRSAVTKNITEPGQYKGEPAIPLKEHQRQQVHVRWLSKYTQRIEELEKRLSMLEQSHPSN